MSKALRNRLQPGEVILWCGQPEQGLRFRLTDFAVVPVTLAVAGVFALLAAPDFQRLSKDPLFFVMAMGLAYYVVGRFPVDALMRRYTQYAVTNRRVLLERGWLRRIELDLRDLNGLRITERSSGRGTISFLRLSTFLTLYYFVLELYTPALDPTPRFLEIDDARNVYGIILKAKVDAERAGVAASLTGELTPPGRHAPA